MNIVILLYKGFTAMDVVWPYEILCRLPGAKVTFAAKEKGVIDSEYPGMKMVATHSLAETESADILLVPGSTFAFGQVMQDDEILHHIRRIDATSKWTTSVCTGALILAAAGLLKGKPATTHWAVLDTLNSFGARSESKRYVHEGKLITAAGMSAGIDMALYLTSQIVDEDYAKMLQLILEYYPKIPTGISDVSRVPEKIETGARTFLKTEIEKMRKEISVQN